MFTGIIGGLGTVKKIAEGQKIKTFYIECPPLNSKLGDSIAINGTCLTVTTMKGQVYSFDVVLETLNRTTLGALTVGEKVNIEKSLTLQTGIDGHLVTGHVDCVARITKSVVHGQNKDVTVQFPKTLKKFIAEKGSITLHGVSLTVTKTTPTTATVTLVPHTLSSTNLATLTVGDTVNLEVDVLARYVYNSTR